VARVPTIFIRAEGGIAQNLGILRNIHVTSLY